MPFQAKDVLSRASTKLIDDAHTRWPLVELLDWLNDGQREITKLAPDAVAEWRILDLGEGTQQTLPTEYASLLRVSCNASQAGPTVQRGRAVTPIQLQVLNAQIPGWQDPAVIPFAAEVQHIIDDPTTHETFMVLPGNDGTGSIEAFVAVRPLDVPVPVDPTNLDQYSTQIGLDDLYLTPLVDYVLSCAYAKDNEVPSAAQAATVYYQKFTTGIGAKTSIEATTNPSTGKNPG